MVELATQRGMFGAAETQTVTVPLARGDIHSHVECVLRDIPETRNDDRLLAFEVWYRFYGLREVLAETTARASTFRAWFQDPRVPTFETISRRRREFRWTYPADPSVEVARQLKGKGVGRPQRR